jgi:hypothetical protein
MPPPPLSSTSSPARPRPPAATAAVGRHLLVSKALTPTCSRHQSSLTPHLARVPWRPASRYARSRLESTPHAMVRKRRGEGGDLVRVDSCALEKKGCDRQELAGLHRGNDPCWFGDGRGFLHSSVAVCGGGGLTGRRAQGLADLLSRVGRPSQPRATRHAPRSGTSRQACASAPPAARVASTRRRPPCRLLPAGQEQQTHRMRCVCARSSAMTCVTTEASK